MKFVKRLPIRGLVLTHKSIAEIAQNISNEYESALSQKGEKDYSYISLNFILRSEDGTQYEDKDISMFKEDGILMTRKIISIEMRYLAEKGEKHISIGLHHSLETNYANEILVSGLDEKWVEGTFAGLQEVFSLSQKQQSFFHKHHTLVSLLFLGCFVFFVYEISGIVFNFIAKFITFPNPETKHSWESASSWALPLISLYLFTFVAIKMTDKLGELYPNIELLLGPEHLRREAGKRRKLFCLLSIVIIPFIIGIIFEIAL